MPLSFSSVPFTMPTGLARPAGGDCSFDPITPPIPLTTCLTVFDDCQDTRRYFDLPASSERVKPCTPDCDELWYCMEPPADNDELWYCMEPPGGGGGGITTTCCPLDPVPTTVTATVTGGGLCNGSYPITYSSGTGNWSYSGIFGTCHPALSTSIVLNCSGSPAAWTLNTVAAITNYTPTSLVCNPLEIIFTNVDLTACGGTANATITIR